MQRELTAPDPPNSPARARMVRAGLLVMVGSMSLLVANLYVLQSARPHLLAADARPEREWAVVPGAHIRDGWPTLVLRARLEPAAQLLLDGRVQRILVSGRTGADYDEPAAMRRFLESVGVPTDRIVEDPNGARTFLTAKNARDDFGITSAVVVTNPFHLPRATFLLRRLGVDAVGLPARPLPDLAAGVHAKWQVREVFARVRAIWDTAGNS